jgi:hypothetical protein
MMMRRLPALTKVTFVLCIFALVLSLGDFLALHDINHDYISARAVRSLDSALSRELPAATGTRAEWTMVSVSLYFRAGFLLLNALTLTLCAQALGQRRPSI